MGIAAVERTSRIPMVRMSSSRVSPASVLRAAGKFKFIWRTENRTSTGLLDFHCGFTRYHLDGPLLRILGIHLDDGELRIPRSDRLHHYTDNCARAAHSRRVRHSGRRNNRLAAFLVDALHDGNFLSSAGQE